MIVYMTQSQKTVLTRMTVEGLPMRRLDVGRGIFARRKALRLLLRLHDSGVRQCVCGAETLLPLAQEAGITQYPVWPLRLALLDELMALRCPAGLQNTAVALRCGSGGEETARAALAALARRARYVRLDMEDPAPLAAELLYRWGIAAGDGGRRLALTVVCGDVREDTEGPTIYLTEDCGARQTPVWTSPRVAALPVPVTEPLAAVLTAAGKWQISDIHITDLLDIRPESHYNAT